MDMLETFKSHLDNHFQFLKNGNLLVACSGGVDSVVLVHLLHGLRYKFAIAHCNFTLRGSESDGDQDFVAQLAEDLNVPLFVERFDTRKYATSHKLSTQMAARELRYRWFEEIRKEQQFDYLITAHHADDDLETFFINLSRGTGLRGLVGIPEINEAIVRPLLKCSRHQIMTYAKQTKLFWREDSSNVSTEYLRNKLRIEVLPQFKAVTPDTFQNFLTTQQHLKQSQSLIDDYMALVYNLVISEVADGYRIDIAKILELPNTEALLYELLHPFGFTAWQDVTNLLTAQTGKKVTSKTHRLVKNRDALMLTEIPLKDFVTYTIGEGVTSIEMPIKLTFTRVSEFKVTNTHTVYVDEDVLQFPLQLRKWEEGDYFYPFGMKGKKKVSKFFKDEKLSLVNKEKTWLLCSQDQIVWVVGHRLDDRFKMTPTTDKLLKIALHQ